MREPSACAYADVAAHLSPFTREQYPTSEFSSLVPSVSWNVTFKLDTAKEEMLEFVTVSFSAVRSTTFPDNAVNDEIFAFDNSEFVAVSDDIPTFYNSESVAVKFEIPALPTSA